MSASPVWRPGDDVTDDTLLKDVSRALAFGTGDLPSWLAIVDKLEGRNCATVGALFKNWGHGEFVSAIRPLGLSKAPKTYATALQDVTERQFKDDGLVIDDAQPAVKKDTGGDMTAACSKVKTTAFVGSAYTPDGRVYVGIPSVVDQKFLSKDDTLAYSDALFLDAHANPAKALGDYIPDGMGKRYAYLHKKMQLPLLWPVGVKPGNDPDTDKARPVGAFVALRFQNGRQGPKYKRIVLDQKFYARFGVKAREHIVWVEADSDLLEDNWRNQLMSELVDAYDGKTSHMTLVFPKAYDAYDADDAQVRLPLPRWPRRLRVRRARHRSCSARPSACSSRLNSLSLAPLMCLASVARLPRRTQRPNLTKRRTRRTRRRLARARARARRSSVGRAAATTRPRTAATTTTTTSRFWTAPSWPPRLPTRRPAAHRRRQRRSSSRWRAPQARAAPPARAELIVRPPPDRGRRPNALPTANTPP